MLDLSPETENNVREYAAREGVSIDELLARTFPPRPQPQLDAKARKLIDAIRQWQVEDATDDEEELDRRDQDRAQLEANLNQSRQQAGMRPLFPASDLK